MRLMTLPCSGKDGAFIWISIWWKKCTLIPISKICKNQFHEKCWSRYEILNNKALKMKYRIHAWPYSSQGFLTQDTKIANHKKNKKGISWAILIGEFSLSKTPLKKWRSSNGRKYCILCMCACVCVCIYKCMCVCVYIYK